jgi:hypothetical protein
MPLPQELSGPPPRDPAAAQAFLAKTRKKATGTIFGGVLLVPVMVGLMWLKFRSIDGLSIGISLGVGGLVALIGVALLVNANRALLLFREGIAVLGRVRKVTAPPDRKGNAYVFIEVEFPGADGAMQVGKVTTISNVTQIDTAAGAEVAVLYSPGKSRQFAIYTPGLGMAVGMVNA